MPAGQRFLCCDLRTCGLILSACFGSWSLANAVYLMHKNMAGKPGAAASSGTLPVMYIFEALMEWMVVGSALLAGMGLAMRHQGVLQMWAVGFGCLAGLVVLELLVDGVVVMFTAFWEGFLHFARGVFVAPLYGYWWSVVHSYEQSFLDLPVLVQRLPLDRGLQGPPSKGEEKKALDEYYY